METSTRKHAALGSDHEYLQLSTPTTPEVRKQIGEGMWSFEQEQKLANITVNVRPFYPLRCWHWDTAWRIAGANDCD